MKSKYDVIIIGAGPAGLSCAEKLKNSDLEILILEKNKFIGPKVCAGGLTFLADSFELPPGKYSKFKEQKIILNEIESGFKLKNPIKTIDRFYLGQYLLSKIKNIDNIYIEKRFVKSIGENHVRLDGNQKIGFNFLVGADGSSSIVRKYLNLPSKFYVGYQFISPEIRKDFTWFLEPEKIKSGYGWIFPHKEFTSVGVYFNPKIVNNRLAKNYLEELMIKNKFDIKNSKFESSPINTLYVGNKFNNIYLAGESSGLVSANTGEGISYALINGGEVAKDILGEGSFKETKKILKFKSRQEIFLKIFDVIGNPRIQTKMFKIFINLLKKPKFQEWYGN